VNFSLFFKYFALAPESLKSSTPSLFICCQTPASDCLQSQENLWSPKALLVWGTKPVVEAFSLRPVSPVLFTYQKQSESSLNFASFVRLVIIDMLASNI